ncbi:MAG: alanine--tRNA ligase [Bacteroidales bacterium]|jgi:alanyl-tRNA synthetase|nr:alanine--tRNA ligase [Bacteroidales bacterium]
MDSKELRQSFLDFFASKSHKIVSSAPMVIKNDPTLMFTNAGMNQFKDLFLGNSPILNKRVSNSQKCLRVSGKHNDLEEVGHDTYHHTMFEMLGNWSFGDYFKEEAIAWAWEYLTETLKIDKESLYITVFEGCEESGLSRDQEAADIWKKYISEDRIINGNKKDNFWEMGDQGPCGPCSEIHIDIRPEEEKAKQSGKELVNMDHPEVIEIWNLVFMEFNRKASGDLEKLPHKHVDTGMGFERLCMVMEKTRSNYDTSVFQPLIQKIASLSGIKYGENEENDIAMRVISDHCRAVSFAIADGQLPSNNKAGYVIRRILRRAIRYGYTYLNFNEPFINQLVPILIENMGDTFTELKKQQSLIEKVIKEEEVSFLKTLATGIRLLDQIIDETKKKDYKTIPGKIAFELYDTYGFPLDLTELILKEKDLVVNRREFEKEMEQQKERSRSAGTVETDDWVEILDDDKEEFIGYDFLDTDIRITRYRTIKQKKKTLYHLVFNYTPFYAESGGQVGDCGIIYNDDEKIKILDTKKEHNVIIHITDKMPNDATKSFKASVNKDSRQSTANNHTATHLLHMVLRDVLGSHVEQKGSLVHPDYLRFDFSHFEKVTDEQMVEIENKVNKLIRKNIQLEEHRAIPMTKATEMGAMALFGEKYGDLVRVIKYDDSIELCGGTHVNATGEIGHFRLLSESSVAAGIRRIEAVTGDKADEYIVNTMNIFRELTTIVGNPKNIKQSVEKVLFENQQLNKKVDVFIREQVKIIKNDLISEVKSIDNFNIIAKKIEIDSADSIRDIAFQIKDSVDNLVLILGAELQGKANLTVMLSENLVKENGLNAGQIVREAAKEIQGGGGGQPFFATAGGKKPENLEIAIEKAKNIILNK